MKKTEKTALTAAVFAAALNLIPSGASSPQTTAQATDNVPVRTDVYPVYGTIPAWRTAPATTEEPEEYPVYGPPPAWNTTTASKPEPVETVPYPVYGTIPAWETMPTTATTTEPVVYPVYGPPPGWNTTTTAPDGPLPLSADINGDGRIDTYDYLLMRQLIVDKNSVWYCDLNGDGETDIADLVRMQKYLLGGDEPYVTTEEPRLQGVYGPPVAFQRNTVTTAADDVPEK